MSRVITSFATAKLNQAFSNIWQSQLVSTKAPNVYHFKGNDTLEIGLIVEVCCSKKNSEKQGHVFARVRDKDVEFWCAFSKEARNQFKASFSENLDKSTVLCIVRLKISSLFCLTDQTLNKIRQTNEPVKFTPEYIQRPKGLDRVDLIPVLESTSCTFIDQEYLRRTPRISALETIEPKFDSTLLDEDLVRASRNRARQNKSKRRRGNDAENGGVLKKDEEANIAVCNSKRESTTIAPTDFYNNKLRKNLTKQRKLSVDNDKAARRNNVSVEHNLGDTNDLNQYELSQPNMTPPTPAVIFQRKTRRNFLTPTKAIMSPVSNRFTNSPAADRHPLRMRENVQAVRLPVYSLGSQMYSQAVSESQEHSQTSSGSQIYSQATPQKAPYRQSSNLLPEDTPKLVEKSIVYEIEQKSYAVLQKDDMVITQPAQIEEREEIEDTDIADGNQEIERIQEIEDELRVQETEKAQETQEIREKGENMPEKDTAGMAEATEQRHDRISKAEEDDIEKSIILSEISDQDFSQNNRELDKIVRDWERELSLEDSGRSQQIAILKNQQFIEATSTPLKIVDNNVRSQEEPATGNDKLSLLPRPLTSDRVDEDIPLRSRPNRQARPGEFSTESMHVIQPVIEEGSQAEIRESLRPKEVFHVDLTKDDSEDDMQEEAISFRFDDIPLHSNRVVTLSSDPQTGPEKSSSQLERGKSERAQQFVSARLKPIGHEDSQLGPTGGMISSAERLERARKRVPARWTPLEHFYPYDNPFPH